MGLVGMWEMVLGSGMLWWVPCLDLHVQNKEQLVSYLKIILHSVNTSQEGLN